MKLRIVPSLRALAFSSASAAWYLALTGSAESNAAAGGGSNETIPAVPHAPFAAVAALIGRDPFAPDGEPVPHADGGDDLNVPEISEDGNAPAPAPAQPPAALRATILGPSSTALVGEGARTREISVGALFGNARVTAISEDAVEFSDGSRLEFPRNARTNGLR